MITDLTGNPHNVMQQTLWAFESYLAVNRNTEKPVLHISLNPSVDDRLTDGQFAELAREYMQKMGYGDQPYIVYLHEDIDRRHVHIVSTCVMKACRELENRFGLKPVADKRNELLEPYLKKADYRDGDVKRQVGNILKSVFTAYRFQLQRYRIYPDGRCGQAGMHAHQVFAHRQALRLRRDRKKDCRQCPRFQKPEVAAENP